MVPLIPGTVEIESVVLPSLIPQLSLAHCKWREKLEALPVWRWRVPLSSTDCGGDSMPPSTRPATPGPSNVPQSSKRTMSDAESVPQHPKKARRNSSAEPSTRRDSHRDAKRRRKRRKKAPVVNLAVKNEATQRRQDERSRAPLSTRNEIIRFASADADPSTGVASPLASPAKYFSPASSSKAPSQSREGSLHTLDGPNGHRSQGMPSTLVRTTKPFMCHNTNPPNRTTRSGLFQSLDLYQSDPWRKR